MFGKIVESPGPIFYEMFIKQLFCYDDVQECKGQGAVGAGSDLQPMPGSIRQFRSFGINHNQVGALLDLLQQQAADLAYFVGTGWVAAPEQDKFISMMKIRYGIKSTGVNSADLPGRMANILYHDHIG